MASAPRATPHLLVCLAVSLIGCGASTAPDGGDAQRPADMAMGAVSPDLLPPPVFTTPATFNVFTEIPQFGVYVNTPPANYSPPAGVLMWSNGTVFVTRLSAMQQSQIGADLAARVTFLAQCDNYDRIGALFLLLEPKGQMPQPSDPRVEIVRWITPFSDYRALRNKHVYPNADMSAFAGAIADPSHDVWIGIAGGSNPYGGDPCTNAGVTADFAAIGFKYTIDFVSSQPLSLAPSVVLGAVANVSETVVPITTTFTNPGTTPLVGHVSVIISGHGSGNGGNEYANTTDDLMVNGVAVGQFNTMIDCAPYASFSPDGNPGIFQGNQDVNPRNWCPGAPVAPHSFPFTLPPGKSTVSLNIDPPNVPSGSNFDTSITFTSP